jgi:hypothetical protein
MPECKGSKEITIIGMTSPWCASEQAARAWIYKEIAVQGRTQLHCDGSCEKEFNESVCKLVVIAPRNIEIEVVEDIFDRELGRFVQGYRASFKGKVTVKCDCAPKTKWF